MTVPSAASAQATADAAVSAAQQQAAESGRPVVVEELTSPTELTTAMPDGTVQYESSSQPVRALKQSAWVPVDTGLVRVGEWWEPAASAVPVRFAPGGDDVLAQVQDPGSGAWVSEVWPYGDLPVPVIAGDTATYAGVFNGVDLKLVATKTGMASIYVVQSEKAALSAPLGRLRVAVEGASLERTETGAVIATTGPIEEGDAVLVAGAPLWWDSSEGGTYREPGGEAPVVPVEHAVTSSELSMDVGESVRAELRSRGSESAVESSAVDAIQYPIFVDPDWSTGINSSWYTDAAYPNASYLSAGASDMLRVGIYQQYRSDMFYEFPLAGVKGKQVLSARLNTTQLAVAACGAQAISVHAYGYHTPGFTWSQEQAWNAAGTGGWTGALQTWTGPDCGSPAMAVGWDVTSGVQGRLAGGSNAVQLAFTYVSPTAPSRRHYSRAATLIVTYNSRPNVPTEMKILDPAATCATSAASAAPVSPTGLSVKVGVKTTDPDPGNVGTDFYLYKGSDLSQIGSPVKVTPRAQGPQEATFSGLVDGQTYAWRALGNDGRLQSAFTGYCYFTVDTTGPGLPEISAPSSGLTVGVAATAAITVDPSDGVDFVAYAVSAAPSSEPFVFDRFTTRPACGSVHGLVRIACPDASGLANVTFAPADAISSIWAVSYDKAGNPSAVPGQPPAEAGEHGKAMQVAASNSPIVSFAAGHVWRTQPQPSPLGASIPDSHASAPATLTLGRDTLRTLKANPLSSGSTLLKSVLGFADPATTGLTGPDFTSSSSSVAAFAGSYAVAAWLKPGTAGAGTAVSMGSGSASRLGVSTAGWEFCIATTSGSSCVTAPRPTGDQWVHVAGVVDVVNGQLRLYLDGSLAASVLRSDGAQNLGSSTVDVGVSRNAGAVTARWPGQIADVAVFSGVPTSSQLGQLRLGQDPAEG